MFLDTRAAKFSYNFARESNDGASILRQVLTQPVHISIDEDISECQDFVI